MSVVYDRYLETHKENVYKAFEWMKDRILDKFFTDDVIVEAERQCHLEHDSSKSDIEEYDAYDKYFNTSRSYDVVKNFQNAWLHHLHNNPHHWQYWVLINDDKDSGEKRLEIPDNYIIEMICDWWSFSWTDGNLYQIFDWYEKGKDYRKINTQSLRIIEAILDLIRIELLDERDGSNETVE